MAMTEADARLLAEIRAREAHFQRRRRCWDWDKDRVIEQLDRRFLLRLLGEALAVNTLVVREEDRREATEQYSSPFTLSLIHI